MNINKSAGIFDFLRPRFRSGGGTHWFPAVDVCTELGYTTPRKALLDHVPEEHRKNLETVTGSHGLSIPAGRSWRRDLNLIDLQWAAEVIETVQREGSYTLEEAEVQPAEPGAPIAYAMPEQVAEAIVRLEERNLQADEQFAVAQHKSLALQQEIVDTQQKIAGTQQKIADTQQEMLDLQRATLAAQQTIAQAMERIADRLDMLAFQRPAPPSSPTGVGGWP